MKIKRLVYPLILMLISASITLQAQQNNKLLDRSFWRSNPSVKEVKKLVKAGNSPTEFNGNMFDATSNAILENASLPVIKYLVGQGNDVNKITHDHRTYLFWAALRSNLEVMEFLKNEGTDFSILDDSGTSALMFAARGGVTDPKVYEFFKANGFDLGTHKHRNGRNIILMAAGGLKDLSLVDYFVAEGADVHATDKDGNGLFHYAAVTGNAQLLKDLVAKYNISYAANKKTNQNAFHFAANARLNKDSQPLALYAYLESLGLDPTMVTTSGANVLHSLVNRTNDVSLIKYFVDKGVYPNQVNESRNTPLLIAAARGSLDEVSYLASVSNAINHQNKEGHTALTRAMKYNQMDVVEMLVKEGADLKVLDKKGFDLSYHVAEAAGRNLKLLEAKLSYLKKKGLNPQAAQPDGSTLLHAVIGKKNKDMLKMLMDMGIDVNAKDNSGQTILHHAAMQAENDELLKFLLQAGADKKVLTEFEESAYDLAKENEILSSSKVNIDFLKPSDQ